MITEQSSATATVPPNEPGPVATEATDIANEPEPQDPFPAPTAEQIKENGFYYYFLPERERPFYKAARESEGLKDVIALMEIKIMEIQASLPDNWAIFLRAMALLDRLVKTHARYFRTAGEADAKKFAAKMPQGFSPAPDIHMNRKMRRDLARLKK